MIDFLPQAKVLFQVELRSASDKTLSLTGGTVQHRRSDLTESTEQIPLCVHQFATQEPDVVDKTFKRLMSDGNPFLRWRVGFSTTQQEAWLPWQEHQVVNYQAMVRGLGTDSGHSFTLTTADKMYTANRMTQIASYRGTISDIVGQIAKSAGLEAVVEPTSGTYAFVQANESGMEFIRGRLLHRAINEKGRGQYLFYLRDNVLHFHSPDYQTQIQQMVFYSTPFVRATQIDRSQQLFDHGVSGVRLIVYDPYTGQSKEVLHDPQKHLRLAEGIYRMGNVPGGIQTLTYHLGTNQPEESVAIAQNVYSFGRSQTFELAVDVSRSLAIRAGDLLQFILAPQVEKTSPWSGYYLVSGVTRTLIKESVRTLYTLKRGEITQDKASIAQTGTGDRLVSETTAPGQDINVPVVQNSVLTAGAGKQESSTIYTTVEDARKAPGA